MERRKGGVLFIIEGNKMRHQSINYYYKANWLDLRRFNRLLAPSAGEGRREGRGCSFGRQVDNLAGKRSYALGLTARLAAVVVLCFAVLGVHFKHGHRKGWGGYFVEWAQGKAAMIVWIGRRPLFTRRGVAEDLWYCFCLVMLVGA